MLRRLVAAGAALLVVACASVPVDPGAVAPSQSAASASARPRLALVLGGGAARGFAHVGVIQALEAEGIVPDLVVGTSAGSLVGALYAGGLDGAALERVARGMREADVRDFMLPGRGFVRGEALEAFVNRQLGGRAIESLPRAFAAVATELATGRSVSFNHGNVGIAVRASSSIPGVYAPVRIAGVDYVDGGVASPLPIRNARALGADRVIAVDVSRRPERSPPAEGVIDVVEQALAVMIREVADREGRDADVLIRPSVDEIGLFDLAQAERAIRAGREAARQALPRLRGLVSSLQSSRPR